MCPDTRRSIKKCKGSIPYGGCGGSGYSGGYHKGGGGGSNISGDNEVSGDGRGSSPHGGRSKGCGGGGRVGGDDEGTGGFSSCGGGTGGGGGGCCPLEVVVSSRGLSSVGPRAEGGFALASLQERFLLRRC